MLGSSHLEWKLSSLPLSVQSASRARLLCADTVPSDDSVLATRLRGTICGALRRARRARRRSAALRRTPRARSSSATHAVSAASVPPPG